MLPTEGKLYKQSELVIHVCTLTHMRSLGGLWGHYQVLLMDLIRNGSAVC